MKISPTLECKLPIIQAPLPGYANQADWIASIANSGALGVLSTEFLASDDIALQINSIKQKTSQAFAVSINLIDDSKTTNKELQQKAVESYLASAHKELKITSNNNQPLSNVNERCKTVVKAKPPIIIFHNGIPADDFIEHCKKVGITTLAVAANTLEAIAIEHSGIDAIILQGRESAGPQSQFENDLPRQQHPALVLLEHSLQLTNKPLYLWGGAQTPAFVEYAISQGATGVVIDTPFWGCCDSPIPESYRIAMACHNEMLIEETTLWTATPANALKNKLSEVFAQSKLPACTPAQQQQLIKPIIMAAVKQDNADYLPLWASEYTPYHTGNTADLCKLFNQCNS